MELALFSASYFGEVSGFVHTAADWSEAERQTTEAYAGPSFEQRFKGLLARMKSLGLTHLELWHPHLAPHSSADQVETAKILLQQAGVQVAAYHHPFNEPAAGKADMEAAFQTAKALGAPLLTGGLHPGNVELVDALCRTYGLRWGLENRLERSPDELLVRIEGFEETIGLAVDTGWFETQGVDARIAVTALVPHIVHVHLKDVEERGSHRTCTLGNGIVDIPEICAVLARRGYKGALAIEHRPDAHDPTEQIRMSLARVREWILRAQGDGWM